MKICAPKCARTVFYGASNEDQCKYVDLTQGYSIYDTEWRVMHILQILETATK